MSLSVIHNKTILALHTSGKTNEFNRNFLSGGADGGRNVFCAGRSASRNSCNKNCRYAQISNTTEILNGKIVKSETKWLIEATCVQGNKSTLKTLTEEQYINLYFDDVHRIQESGIAPVVSGKSKIITSGQSRIITDEMTIKTTIYGECK